MNKDKDRRSYTEAYQTHEDCGYGYKVVCCYDDKYSKHTRIYRGENAVYKFMEKMLEEVEYCKAVIKKRFNKPLVMTEVDEQHFKTMDGCHICGEKYTDKDVQVRDHCHITGKFRGSVHQECNLKLRIKPENLKIPVIFHNLRGCKAVIKKRFNKPLVMTEVDEQHFKTMDGCHICGEKYTDKDVQVRDHCHITGKFRGSVHQECNLKLRIKPENLKIPVIFHNLRGYDSHFIMQRVGEIANKHGYTNNKGEKQDLNINAIPNNMEKYMAFMLGNHLTFIDRFQFMSSSLDKLVSNLPKDDLIYHLKLSKVKGWI